MLREPRDRRIKCLYLRPEIVARFFDAATITRDHVQVPQFKDLPIGYSIEHIHVDICRQNICFVLYHPSWRALDECEEVPILDVGIECVVLARRSDGTESLERRPHAGPT